MSDEPLLPRRMTLLGKAMHPIWLKLKVQIEMPVSRTSTVSAIAGFVSDHLDDLQEAVGRLEDRINGLMSDVVSKENASDAEVDSAVGRIESPVDDLLASYHAIRAVRAAGKDAEARDLLADVYRHALGEIRDWLGVLVEVIADPMAAVQKRGLPPSDYVELPVNLTLTAAPALGRLSRWSGRQSVSLARAS